MRFARTARRMREMVYDDTRWVARLQSMGCWNEVEAKRRFEEAVRRRREAAHAALPAGSAQPPIQQHQQAPPQRQASTTIFDASVEEDRQRQQQASRVSQARDGFETMTLGAKLQPPPPKNPMQDPLALLDILKNARSARGHARQEYGKVYGALSPFYLDLAKARSHTDPVLFKVFRDPERQAQMLANLAAFARSDWAEGWRQREEKLAGMTSLFESAVLREFEQGYEFWDVDGRMKRYAHVLDLLGGSTAAVELFIHKHPMFSGRDLAANPMDCINQASYENITLEPSRDFFDGLSRKLREQGETMARIFPKPGAVFWAFVDKVREDVIVEYATPLFDECHERSMASYLKAVSGVFEQCLQFLRTLEPPRGASERPDTEHGEERARETALKVFEPHLDLYLQEELDFFTKHAEAQVAEWEKRLSEQDATVESFYMGNFNRQEDKKDFLSSFKKVVMMPVTVLPSLPGQLLGASPFGSSKPASAAAAAPALAPAPAANGAGLQPASPQPSRPHTAGIGTALERTGSPLPDKAPNDELAAKAALMASRLEGIKSLFSIEMALSLVHAAKASLGRAAVFVALGGQAGEEAREQCAAIFVVLLRVLGTRHVKQGFDRAVAHLSTYNPREVSDHGDGAAGQAGVAPLVMFIELVNVGDLISQMVDVFYEQQVAGPRIADRNDFLDPAALAKKKFEQMLDESVAAGLNKGIDVLMDEVEFLCATTQPPSDYNPPEAAGRGLGMGGDMGPTPTARRVMDLVRGHTSMLVGSTEKTMLDVFNGEVGLRLFTAVCKHLKRQRVSTEGAIKLIADVNLYFDWARSLRNQDLLAYFRALRELSQIYLIDAKGHAKEMAVIIADQDRFGGIFRAEEVYEFAERRADWYQVKRDVERAMYGLECCVI